MNLLFQIVLHLFLLLVLPPLLLGIINRVKALFAGRVGAPLLQPYYDLRRLWGKGAVYSHTTTWIFRVMPTVVLATTFAAGLLVPLQAGRAPLDFEGGVLAFAYLLAMGRMFTMLAALDTGSAFEGMGASREAAFSALTEPALFLVLAILCVPAGTLSFTGAFAALPWAEWGAAHPEYLVAAVVLFVVMLTECSRIPVDDPNTHLELTMIHEVMVLDHSGPDFAVILYANAMKLFLLAALITHVVLPIPPDLAFGLVGLFLLLVGTALVAVAVGIVESMMGRLRLLRIPQFLIGAAVLALVGLGVVFFRGTPSRAWGEHPGERHEGEPVGAP